MRHEFRRLNGAALLVLGLLVGCSATVKHPSAIPAPAPTPIVYSTFSKPQPLTESELQEIQSSIAEAKSEHGQVWFLYVRLNSKGLYRADVYYEPNQSTGRVHHGRVLRLQNSIPGEQRREIEKRLGRYWPSAQDYVQIAAPDSTAEPRTPPPAEAQLPFPPPERLSDDQLLRVVETAQAAARAADADPMPVKNIELGKDGSIRVYLGWQAERLYGGGRFVDLKPDGSNFLATGVGMWVS